MRWGVISDIHGNLEALTAVVDELARFGAERFVCLGDLVGYGPRPNEVVAAVRELDPLMVAGNHDRAVCGTLKLEWFAEVPRACLEWTIAVLRPEAQAFLRALPVTADWDGMRLVHALPPDSSTTYLTEAALPALVADLDAWREALCFVGHTHRPQLVVVPAGPRPSTAAATPGDERQRGARRRWRRDERGAGRSMDLILQPLATRWRAPGPPGRAVVNIGSVGQPRDGDPRAFCALWDDDRRTLEARRVVYDVEHTIADMTDAGLPAEPALRLRTGS